MSRTKGRRSDELSSALEADLEATCDVLDGSSSLGLNTFFTRAFRDLMAGDIAESKVTFCPMITAVSPQMHLLLGT